METKTKLVERQYLLPFILITTLFALWGFANDITNPMVAGFQTIMELSAAIAIRAAFCWAWRSMPWVRCFSFLRPRNRVSFSFVYLFTS